MERLLLLRLRSVGCAAEARINDIPVARTPAGGGATLDGLGAISGGSSADIVAATARLQESNQLFSMQYLELQEKMQEENRQYSTLSNVLKTRHESAKTAINNIR